MAMTYLPHFRLCEFSQYIKHGGINTKEASPTKQFMFSLIKFFQKEFKNVLFLVFHNSLNSLFTKDKYCSLLFVLLHILLKLSEY